MHSNYRFSTAPAPAHAPTPCALPPAHYLTTCLPHTHTTTYMGSPPLFHLLFHLTWVFFLCTSSLLLSPALHPYHTLHLPLFLHYFLPTYLHTLPTLCWDGSHPTAHHHYLVCTAPAHTTAPPTPSSGLPPPHHPADSSYTYTTFQWVISPLIHLQGSFCLYTHLHAHCSPFLPFHPPLHCTPTCTLHLHTTTCTCSHLPATSPASLPSCHPALPGSLHSCRTCPLATSRVLRACFLTSAFTAYHAAYFATSRLPALPLLSHLHCTCTYTCRTCLTTYLHTDLGEVGACTALPLLPLPAPLSLTGISTSLPAPLYHTYHHTSPYSFPSPGSLTCSPHLPTHLTPGWEDHTHFHHLPALGPPATSHSKPHHTYLHTYGFHLRHTGAHLHTCTSLHYSFFTPPHTCHTSLPLHTQYSSTLGPTVPLGYLPGPLHTQVPTGWVPGTTATLGGPNFCPHRTCVSLPPHSSPTIYPALLPYGHSRSQWALLSFCTCTVGGFTALHLLPAYPPGMGEDPDRVLPLG